MTILRSLAGWIAFAIALGFATEPWAALVGLTVSVLVLVVGFRVTGSASTLVIEMSTAAFFALATVLGFMLPAVANGPWVSVASQVWLAVTVAVTLAIHTPFTLPIARRQAPREVWNTTRFYDFNVKITRAWLVSFTISSVILISITLLASATVWLHVPVIVAAIVLPVAYTRRQVAALRSATPESQPAPPTDGTTPEEGSQ